MCDAPGTRRTSCLRAPPPDTPPAGPDERWPRTIPVTVNGDRVELPERELTGLEIKETAIAQGVEIQPDFQLSVQHGNRYRVVGDAETLRVRPNQEFLAVAPDDNS